MIDSVSKGGACQCIQGRGKMDSSVSREEQKVLSVYPGEGQKGLAVYPGEGKRGVPVDPAGVERGLSAN